MKDKLLVEKNLMIIKDDLKGIIGVVEDLQEQIKEMDYKSDGLIDDRIQSFGNWLRENDKFLIDDNKKWNGIVIRKFEDTFPELKDKQKG